MCLELAKGPLVYDLQKYDFLVLFPVNPAILAKYRQAFTPSQAKDDPTDAELQLELLLRHRDKLKRLPYALWPSSGFGSSIAAGRTARPTTNRHISTLKRRGSPLLSSIAASP